MKSFIFRCVNGRLFTHKLEFSCAPGTLFDSTDSVCKLDPDKKCSESQLPISPTQSGDKTKPFSVADAPPGPPAPPKPPGDQQTPGIGPLAPSRPPPDAFPSGGIKPTVVGPPATGGSSIASDSPGAPPGAPPGTNIQGDCSTHEASRMVLFIKCLGPQSNLNLLNLSLSFVYTVSPLKE